MSDFSRLLEMALENPPAEMQRSRTVKREDGTVVTLNVRNPLVADGAEVIEQRIKQEAEAARAEAKSAAEPPPAPRPAPKR